MGSPAALLRPLPLRERAALGDQQTLLGEGLLSPPHPIRFVEPRSTPLPQGERAQQRVPEVAAMPHRSPRRFKQQDYCALMLAPRITLPHFSVSSTMIWPHCAGVSGSVSLPRSANLALMPGSLSPTFTSALSFAMTSAGVPLGAPSPLRRLAS